MQNRPSFLPKLAVTRPVTIIVSLLAIIVLGGVAYKQIPIELLPSGFSYPALGVWTPYPNANPQEVEEQIARPIEEQVRTIPGVTKVETYSSSNGCWTWMEFGNDVDMDAAYDQLRDRMERARAMLPDDLDRYYLRRFGRNDEPIIFLSISFPEGVDDPYYIVEKLIKQPIERIDGVANIETWGADEKSIQILIDQDKVKAHQINVYEVISEMRSDNFAMSSGWVYEGDKKFIVRSLARFKSLQEIAAIPINKFGLTIGDIAEVKYDVPERNWTQRVNGGQGVLMDIYKESLSNTVEMSHKLKTLLNEEILTHPKLKSADVQLLFVQGDLIEDSVNNLRDTAIWGGVFAIFILLFFLKNLRMTIIMMFAIPLSILISLIFVYFIGWTLNLIVMMGLMISVGMVVDNGIVVLENIYRMRSEGKPSRESSIWGASEVNLAIIMATLTTIAVFVPILIIKDGAGGFNFYMQRIGLPVIFSLLGSLFVALVLIPLATTHFSGGGMAQESKMVTRLKSIYGRVLAKILNRRLDTVLAVVLILFVTFGVLGPMIQESDGMEGNISDLRLMFDLPTNLTKDDTNRFFKEVEDTVFAKAKEYNIRAVDTGFRQGFGRVRVYLQPPEKQQWYDVVYKGVTNLVGLGKEEPLSRDEVLEDLKKRIPLKPGIKFRTSWRGSGMGDEGTVTIMLYGDDTGKLAELAEEVERRMRTLDGVISVETDREAGEDEIKIKLDREATARNGINANQVANTLMYAVRGLNLPRFQATDREIDVRIQVQEEDRESLLQIKDMSFTNQQGRSVPLSAMATFNIEKGFGQIGRTDGKTFLAVKAQTTANDMPRISAQIDQLMADFTLPYGYDWSKGDRFRRFREQGQAMQTALMLSVVLVYLLMAILFESFILPLSIMFAIPLSIFGANLALVISQTPQDLMAGIGIIILVGVVVNNGIVLVDMINRRRREGYSRRDAILDAGKNRFRPIMMTSFTTIFGIVPMALGSGDLIGIPYAPMGRVIIGGMLTSTFLTLTVIPVFYTLFDDLAIFFKRVVGWLVKGKSTGDVAVPSEN